MKVKFFAYIRDYTKTKVLEIEYYETLEELLQKLCDMFGEKLKNAIFDGEDLSKEIIIMVNGRHVVHLNGIKTKLKATDEISIFPIVAGG